MTDQFVPEMKEDGECPYCGGPTVNVAFEFITCGAAWNKDCFGHQVRTPVEQVPHLRPATEQELRKNIAAVMARLRRGGRVE